MRTLDVLVDSTTGLRAKGEKYCEATFRETSHKSKAMNGCSCKWDQQITLGTYGDRDFITFRIHTQDSQKLLGEGVLPLLSFSRPGTFNEEIPLGDGIMLHVVVTIKRSGRIRRSSSVKALQNRFVSGRTATGKSCGDVDCFASIEERNITKSSITPIHNLPPPTTAVLSVLSKKEKRLSRRVKASVGDIMVPVEEVEILPQLPRQRLRRQVALNKLRAEPLSSPLVLDSMKEETSSASEPHIFLPTPTAVAIEKAGKSRNNSKKSRKRTRQRPPLKMFGTSLSKIMNRQRSEQPDLDLTIPMFYKELANIILKKGTSRQGIFRVRGKSKEVFALKAIINTGKPIEEDQYDIHAICTVFKSVLQELPSPILRYRNYSAFISIGEKDKEDQVKALRELFCSLPPDNFNLLKFLFSFLLELSLNCTETQMDASNLARVFAPNLVWKEVVDLADLSLIQDSMTANALTEIVITNTDLIFVQNSS